MKSIYAILAAVLMSCCLSLTANAQPRAVGLRFGATGMEASYQHSLNKNFIEAEAGMDFGYGGAGFKVSASYNFILARPALAALKDYTAQRKTGRNPVFKAASIDLKEKTDYWN